MLELAQVELDQAQVVASHRVVGFEADDLAICITRILELVTRQERVAEVELRGQVLGVDREALLVLGDLEVFLRFRLTVANSFSRSSPAQSAVRLRIA